MRGAGCEDRLLHDGRSKDEALDMLASLSIDGMASVTLRHDGLTISGPDLHLRFPKLPWNNLNNGWLAAVSHHGRLMIGWQTWDTAWYAAEEFA